MSYQVFARKYRPQDFDSVVGQEHITRTLKNAIEQNRLAHAYLFVGPRGVGKTSTARILAKALNCERGISADPCGKCDMCKAIATGTSLNVLEFDAASNTQVDKIREIIIENVKYAPTSGKYKLYIVDEVHMLSNSSFNALLKTLEEPPAHVIFIFATTDVQKVPTTIISRCQRFDLRRIPTNLISKHLLHIAKLEKIALDDAAAHTIAKGAEGGLRDAESMLDQLVAFCGDKIGEADVLSIFGFTAQQTVAGLCGHIINADASAALGIVNQQADDGKDLSVLLSDLIEHLRDVLVIKADPNAVDADLDEAAIATIKAQSEKLPMDRVLELIDQLAAAETRMKWAPNKKLHFEIAVIKAIHTLQQTTLSEVIDTLATLRSGGEVKLPAKSPALPAPAPALRREAAPISAPAPKPKPAESAPVVAPPEKSEPPAHVAAENFWPELLRLVRSKRPLASPWVEAGALLKLDGETCLVGFPKNQSFAMESLQRPNNRKFLEELAASLAGHSVTLKFELRDGLVVESQPAPEPPPAPLTPEQQQEKKSADFVNDPLIKRALELFEGEIVSN